MNKFTGTNAHLFWRRPEVVNSNGGSSSQLTTRGEKRSYDLLNEPPQNHAAPVRAQTQQPVQPLNGNNNVNKQAKKDNDSLTICRPISELPPRFRPIFPYVNFNRVQSLVYTTMLDTSKPVVVSAPTGSGKTGVFELAIVKTIMDCERRSVDLGMAKIIYLAPTKALCTERREDWSRKFAPYNIQCIELTSDMNHHNINFKNLNQASILLATPEKWDSITRSWNGHQAFVKSIRLLLVDEVHLVNDGVRGATLEAVISRMKTIRSVIWPTEQDNLRFVAVSATVSNIQDIAEWFSTPTYKAQIHQVDPKERPVKLRTVVLGYTTNANINEFSFDSLLNHKLADVVKEHSNDKPVLIFCATRKSCTNAATVLCKEGKFDVSYSVEKRKLYLEISKQVKDKVLQETTRYGIAFHHAGLCASDRRTIESGFIDGAVMILCCTSTLAMGVNLPAHLVIIKNTSYYDGGEFKPYSESSLVQMIGRAGRPQFDTDATAVIMTKSFCRDSIERMLTGRLVVESQLHKFLTEHINSEIVLGTIHDDMIARKWIDSTFLHVRLRKAPENYGLAKNSSAAAKENMMIAWCKISIQQLIDHGMIKRSKQGQLEATDAGRSMARHYVCLDTMTKLVRLAGSETIWDLIKMICSCQEIVSDIQVRNEDKPGLSALCNPKEGNQRLRFSLGDKIITKEQKGAALLQATFGNLAINENSLLQESIRITRNASRIMNCLKDVAMMDGSIGYNLLLNVLLLSQIFSARLWEDSIYVSKQLEKIGATLSHNLANNGLTTFESLRKANPRNIEIFCGRLPPFGSNVQQTCFGLPVYQLDISFRAIPNQYDKIQLLVEISIANGQDIRCRQSLPSQHETTVIVGNKKDNKLLLRQQVTDGALLARPDLTICFGADLSKLDLPNNHEEIEGRVISDSFVGLDVQKIVKYVEPEEELG